MLVDEETEAKEWLAKNGPPPAPETPTSNKRTRSDDRAFPVLPKTPWTEAKRKPVSREALDTRKNGETSVSKTNGGEFRVFEDLDSPSRKVLKAAKFSTPGQTFNDRLRNAAQPLPTPDSLEKPLDNAATTRSRPSNRTSPTPARLESMISPNSERTSNLAVAVLMLIHSENVELKESTELQIRHEIDLEVDSNEAKVRRYEETIRVLSKRLDELENIVLHLVGSDEESETIRLSD